MEIIGRRGITLPKPKYTEESIQQALYLNHPILTNPAFEMVGFIFYEWESDYLAISKAGYVYECEIKISHSDFLNEAARKQEKMRILSDGNQSSNKRPNYFWYVCPEGIISKAECPKFAGLMYITDSGMFRCIKTAPGLHKAKFDTQVDLLRRDMREKFYYAMWNWIRRYWRNVSKAKDIAPQTAAAYEKVLAQAEAGIPQEAYDRRGLHCGDCSLLEDEDISGSGWCAFHQEPRRCNAAACETIIKK